MSKKSYSPDPNGAHRRLYDIVLNSVAWRCLSPAAKGLWCDLRAQVGSTNNGAATTALAVLSHRGWSSRHTIMRARQQLEALGFIRLTLQGGIASGGKKPNLYRFTDLDMYELPKYKLSAIKADHLYKSFREVREAKATLRLIKNQPNKKEEV
ncbi:hypothetical protein [Polynucleobacter yangtzensis]|uniref:hypothetical protein n=1 Tax=Polynucleobacter yangtzensis TaxID=1743159 RepID=UPI00082D648D|nr:hypothetical protein [Polynucleobacter yangtzensis]